MTETTQKTSQQTTQQTTKETTKETTKDRLARERADIAARVASFKATQEKFQREREEYYTTTLENARQTEHGRHTLDQIPFWS